MRKVLILLMLLVFVGALVVSVQADFGTNWSATVYDNRRFENEVGNFTGINGVNFNWATQPVINGQNVNVNNPDAFSVRFTSTQTFIQGNYRFDVTWDDQVRVIIDGQTAFEDFSTDGIYPKQRTFDREMSGGPHSITIELVERGGVAVIQFQWNLVGTNITPGVGTVFPTLMPSGTPVPPLTASLVQVRGLAVRTGPYLGATMITTALTGQQYPVYARAFSEEGVTWYKITVNEKTGWSSGRYLTFTAPVDGLPVEGSVFDTLDNAPETGVIASPRSIMNLRARPSVRTPILGTIPWGAELPLLGRTVQAGIDRWYQVRYNGQVGWIIAPYISVRGDIRQVPIH